MNPLNLRFVKVTSLCGIVVALGFALCQQMQAATDTPKPTDDVVPVSNNADGHLALASITTGIYNSAFGFYALLSLTDGNFCTAMGGAALLSNTGSENTATGCSALFSNINADNNTADGAFALFFNTTGDNNTAVGNRALESNIDGSGHTAVGSQTLFSNRHAGDNTAVGDSALFLDDSSGLGIGAHNTAVGNLALTSNIDGGLNTGIGDQALMNSTGTGNTALGASAGGAVTTANGVICIGSAGADVSNTAWIGNVFGVTTVSGTTAPVIVSDTGQLGTVVSSERFKKDINPMDRTSEDILSLRPVTFHYKSDAKGTPQFGLIAEEVAKVNSSLVIPDKEGKPFTVRYDAVNAMLLNEFLKEHRKVEQLEKQVEALTAGLRKVSAQLELTKSAPQTVLNSH